MSNSARLMKISRAAARKAGKEADDLEAAALRAGISIKVSLDESVYDQEISEEDSEEDSDDEESDLMKQVTERENSTEQLVTAAVSIVQQRRELLGDIYPFQVSASGLEYIGSRTLVYELCLAIVYVDVSENPYKQLQIAFERLAGSVMSIILGPGAEFARTGYPPVAGEPLSFNETIAMLNEKMTGEWATDLNSRLEDPKDGGMDAVVWKRLDQRPGSLIYVANCGCGNNWLKENKHRARPSEQIGRLLSRPKPYHVGDFFCVPFHISESRDWDEACDHGRVVLDRVRLALTAEGAGEEWATRGQGVEVISDLIKIADSSYKPGAREQPS
jgi:hypothetical protein